MSQAFRNTAAGARAEEQNTIINPSSKLQWLSYKLSDSVKTTRFRILPGFAEDGKEEYGLNPEGDPNKWDTMLGSAFACVEIANQYLPITRGRKLFCATTFQDSAGNPVRWSVSPFMVFNKTLYYKIRNCAKLKEKKYPVDIPEAWFDWFARGTVNLTNVQMLACVQVFLYEYNGDKIVTNDGKPTYKPGCVIALPPGACKGFFTTIGNRVDAAKPFTPDNLEEGCDVFSTAAGKMVKLTCAGEGKGRKYFLTPSNVVAINTEAARKYVKPWQDVFSFTNADDQIKLLREEFGSLAVAFALHRTFYSKYLTPQEIEEAKTISVDTRKIEEIEALEINTATVEAKPAAEHSPRTNISAEKVLKVKASDSEIVYADPADDDDNITTPPAYPPKKEADRVNDVMREQAQAALKASGIKLGN